MWLKCDTFGGYVYFFQKYDMNYGLSKPNTNAFSASHEQFFWRHLNLDRGVVRGNYREFFANEIFSLVTLKSRLRVDFGKGQGDFCKRT